MHFCHSDAVWADYPELVPGVLAVDGVSADGPVGTRTARFEAVAAARLATASEGEFPEIQAWRRTFARLGLKPTQYRCASEALLRRFKKEASFPQIHPLIDLCNAISLAFAIPVAVFDTGKIADYLEVRYATGAETYESFSGDVEHPATGEVIFADAAGRAHARRWTNRQAATSAVGRDATSALVVAEAMHTGAEADVERLIATIRDELEAVWPAIPQTALLTRASPRFELTA
jgi:DNA/RNA-binding domain of Phe-tRNA-synthetase-like protein